MSKEVTDLVPVFESSGAYSDYRVDTDPVLMERSVLERFLCEDPEPELDWYNLEDNGVADHRAWAERFITFVNSTGTRVEGMEVHRYDKTDERG